MTTGIGYSHALFSQGNLRSYAVWADKKENGGNDNGLIDGNEIANFKQKVKKHTGFDFSFDNIKQSIKKEVDIKDSNNNWLYSSAGYLALKYQNNGTSSKTILALNGGDPFRDNNNKKAFISYMSEDDFKTSQAEVERQSKLVDERIADEQRQEAQKKQREAEDRKISNNPLREFWKIFILGED